MAVEWKKRRGISWNLSSSTTLQLKEFVLGPTPLSLPREPLHILLLRLLSYFGEHIPSSSLPSYPKEKR